MNLLAQTTCSFLNAWVKQASGHPLLLTGSNPETLLEAADYASRAIICQSHTDGGCGTCSSCMRITKHIYPDVRLIDRAFQAELRKEDIEKQLTLRLETIHAERKRLMQTAVEGSWKISVFVEAHRLTNESANALLKILEEPPPKTTLFLLTSFIDRLPKTILSRMQRITCLREASVSRAPLAIPVEDLVQQMTQPLSGKTTRNDIEEKLNLLIEQLHPNFLENPERVEPLMRISLQGMTYLRHNVSPSLVWQNCQWQISNWMESQ